MNIFSRFLPILAIALVLPACDDSPTDLESATQRPQYSDNDPAVSRYVFENVWDFNGGISGVFCEDGTESEPILTRGKVFEKWVITYLPNGNITAQLSSMGVGLGGTGTISGADYRIKESDHAVSKQNDKTDLGMYRSSYRVESHELGKSFRFSVKGTFRIVNDEVVASRERIREECEL